MSWEDEIDWDADPDAYSDPFKYVLGLDPGGTTGVALLRYTEETAPELVYLHQIPDGLPGYYAYFANSWPEDNLDIASEQWKERNVKGADRTPQYIEGAQYAMWYGTEKLTYQYPELKKLVPDEWLKQENLWTPGKRHQMDALIHAIVFLRNSGHKPTIEALSNMPTKPLAEPGEAEAKTKGDNDGDSFNGDIQEAQQNGDGEDGDVSEDQADGDGEASEAEADGESGEGTPQGEAQDQAIGKPTGPGDNENQKPSGHDYENIQPKGDRKRRERNGVFTGYEAEGEETVLYVD